MVNIFGRPNCNRQTVPKLRCRGNCFIYLFIVYVKIQKCMLSCSYQCDLFLHQGYFDTARLELAEYNIGVQIVCPGPVMSDVLKNAFTEDINRVISGL